MEEVTMSKNASLTTATTTNHQPTLGRSAEMKQIIDMKKTSRILLVLLAVTALAAGGPAMVADRHDRPGATKVFTLDPSTHGNPEGVAFDPRTGAFFVGATGDGTIYRGTLDNPAVTEFIAGAPGREAVGMK